MWDEIVAAIEGAELPAPVWRTARRLLDRLSEDGSVTLRREVCAGLCGSESDGTMRSHLGQLARAGILRYGTRDGVVWVSFVIGERAPVISERAWVIDECAPVIAERAWVIAERASARSEREVGDEDLIAERAEDEGRALSENVRAPGARLRALSDQNGSLLVGMDGSIPDPGGRSIHTNQSNHSVSVSSRRVRALLGDAEVGLKVGLLRELPDDVQFEWVLRVVLQWRRDVAAGRVDGTGALVHRLRIGRSGGVWEPPELTVEDCEEPLVLRHWRDAGEVVRRRGYLPDTLRDVIIG